MEFCLPTEHTRKKQFHLGFSTLVKVESINPHRAQVISDRAGRK